LPSCSEKSIAHIIGAIGVCTARPQPHIIRFPSHRKEHRMKKSLLAAALIGAASVAGAAGFTLTSPDIKPNSTIDKKFEANVFGCSGENKSPDLKWSGAPKDTKSFAVTVYDPDAPTGSGFWHWFVINIPANVTELKPDAGNVSGANLPPGAKNVPIDYGFAGWGGPCPPEGDKPHRYIFTVYALKTDKLDIPADATAALAGVMANANAIGKASFTAKYGRPKKK
jgi:Raf kinase inhibitor-like YbhB/YbcL family protein